MRSSVADVAIVAGGGGEPSPIDPEAARRAARDILSGPEYDEAQPGLVERTVSWVLDRLGDFFGALTGGGPGGVVGWIVGIALLALAVWLLARTLRVPSVARPGSSDGFEIGTESRRHAGVWLAEAGRLTAAGDHRGAMRCRYQALVARLVTDGVLDDIPGRTAGEYRTELTARRPECADLIAAVTSRFETTWYGGAPVEAAAGDDFAAACTRLERSAHDTSPRQTTGPTVHA